MRLGSSFRWLLLTALLGAPAASTAQQSPAPLAAEDRFSHYRRNLLEAADGVLIGLQEFPQGRTEGRIEQKPLSRAREEDRTALEAFASRYWRARSGDLRAAIARLEQIRPELESALQAEGLPTELVAVVLVESAARSTALSPRGARGLWQFIPATARRYGLSVGPDLDERIDTGKATRAAARYLRDLHERFGNWSLALAAYNAGEEAIERAIAVAGTTEIAVLNSKRLLPSETRNYVAAVVAAMSFFRDEGPTELRELAKQPGRTFRTLYALALPSGSEGGSGDSELVQMTQTAVNLEH